jgi:hypothetical protein
MWAWDNDKVQPETAGTATVALPILDALVARLLAAENEILALRLWIEARERAEAEGRG